MTTPRPDAYRDLDGHLHFPTYSEAMPINWTPLWFSETPPVPEPTPEPQGGQDV